MSDWTPDTIIEALDENRGAPPGPARTARAEDLVEAAEPTGDRPLTVRALQDLVDAYQQSGESDRILVPFARVLRMWDADPGDFDEYAGYALHWHFKWVTSGMLSRPNVPLATIRRWLTEMETRYRQAGYQMYAVYHCQFEVADHVGDHDEAARAFDRWLGAERDVMADCHACCRNNQGSWLARTRRPAEAVAAWQPVLDGELTCAEEPHRVLGRTLVPLLELDQPGAARANHLRGYPMARHRPSLRRTVGNHVEFAALTGNEPRGLEILAEHAEWLADTGENRLSRLGFLEGAALLLRRLVAIGRGELPIATPRGVGTRGTGPTTPAGELLAVLEAEITELAGRFDARNGTAACSERAAARLARQPLLASLPLGLRARHLTAPAPAPAADGAAAPSAEADAGVGHDVEELTAEAQRLDECHHPRAGAAWERLAALGEPLPALTAARIAEHRALELAGRRPAGAVAALREVAGAFTAAGSPGAAVLNEARAGLAAAISATDADRAATASAEIATAVASVTDLHAAGEASGRQLLATRLCLARDLMRRWTATLAEGAPDQTLYDALRAELAAIRASADDLDLPMHGGSAAELLATAQLWTGRHEEAEATFRAAADGFLAAGAPWRAAEPLLTLADFALRHDDLDAAEQLAAAAAGHGGDLLAATAAAQVLRLRAEIAWRHGGRDLEVVDLAVDAAARFDDTEPWYAARCRLRAAYGFARSGRPAEAAALLDAAMPELEEHLDPDDLVTAQHRYGQCLAAIGEPRDAARVLLAAASTAATWPDQTAHASLAHEAAGVLEAADMPDQALLAYRRAADLWRGLGVVESAVRATRGAAWLMVGDDEHLDWAGAQAAFEAAEAEVATAIAEHAEAERPGAEHAGAERPGVEGDASGDGRAGVSLRLEHAETLRQFAQLLLRWPVGEQDDDAEARAGRGLALAEAAAKGFAAMGQPDRADQAQLLAAQLEIHGLGRLPAGADRLRALRRAAGERGDGDLVGECDQYLGWLGRQPGVQPAAGSDGTEPGVA